MLIRCKFRNLQIKGHSREQGHGTAALSLNASPNASRRMRRQFGFRYSDHPTRMQPTHFSTTALHGIQTFETREGLSTRCMARDVSSPFVLSVFRFLRIDLQSPITLLSVPFFFPTILFSSGNLGFQYLLGLLDYGVFLFRPISVA
jgi:hypothetical protein